MNTMKETIIRSRTEAFCWSEGEAVIKPHSNGVLVDMLRLAKVPLYVADRRIELASDITNSLTSPSLCFIPSSRKQETAPAVLPAMFHDCRTYLSPFLRNLRAITRSHFPLFLIIPSPRLFTLRDQIHVTKNVVHNIAWFRTSAADLRVWTLPSARKTSPTTALLPCILFHSATPIHKRQSFP
jgi:hypothetical protein